MVAHLKGLFHSKISLTPLKKIEKKRGITSSLSLLGSKAWKGEKRTQPRRRGHTTWVCKRTCSENYVISTVLPSSAEWNPPYPSIGWIRIIPATAEAVYRQLHRISPSQTQTFYLPLQYFNVQLKVHQGIRQYMHHRGCRRYVWRYGTQYCQGNNGCIPCVFLIFFMGGHLLVWSVGVGIRLSQNCTSRKKNCF